MFRTIKELGLENRVPILQKLLGEDKSLPEIRKELKNEGVNKPYITVSRYLESLRAVGLVEKEKGVFTLSPSGQLTLSFLEHYGKNLKIIQDYRGFFSSHSLSLPWCVSENLFMLEEAELWEDSLSLSLRITSLLERAERARVLLPKVGREMQSLLEKVKDSTVVTGKESLNMGVVTVDNAFACLYFPGRGGRVDLNSGFASSTRGFIEWAERIFRHYQKEAPPPQPGTLDP